MARGSKKSAQFNAAAAGVSDFRPDSAPDNALGPLYDDIRHGNFGGFLRKYARLLKPPVLPVLLSAVDWQLEPAVRFMADDARRRLPAVEWRQALRAAMAHAAGGGNAAILSALLDNGADAHDRDIWTAAAKAGRVDILKALQPHASSSGPQALARVSAAFESALEAQQYDAADFLATAYPGLIDEHGLKSAAGHAMMDGNAKAALFAIKKIEDLIPPTNDILRRIYNSLMSDAIQTGALDCIDYLYGKSQTGIASGMAASAHYDRVDSLQHFIAKGEKNGAEIPKIDLETTLSIASDHRALNVIGVLLEKGVSPRVHGDKPMRQAAGRYIFDGFAPVERLLRHGVPVSTALLFAQDKLTGQPALVAEIRRYEAQQNAEALKSTAAKRPPERPPVRTG